jgi:hypothetical protein
VGAAGTTGRVVGPGDVPLDLIAAGGQVPA